LVERDDTPLARERRQERLPIAPAARDSVKQQQRRARGGAFGKMQRRRTAKIPRREIHFSRFTTVGNGFASCPAFTTPPCITAMNFFRSSSSAMSASTSP